MKRNITKTALFSIATVWMMSGCTGTEATPRNATQTGVATGAVAGAVIGYNASGRHKGRNAVLGAAAGALAGGAIGNAVDEQNPEPVNDGGWQ
ncbi:YMGG-like glycine zipper-containing protein [Sulfurovum mangrovi]|uniref:YMGG-like glycine zipper-containing protein n=1 Tax=Sulfurovum mangrovi TaxID=2893889 RepID=UPI001E342168|nr:glycine zipper domain-containing protein [Sulfurovum mangrovi]UFH59244.1 glycine zipper domain-containing protein [Sulfurovum mangrovi]